MTLKNAAPLRFFTKDKLLESKLLNRMGVQVMRTLAARGLYNVRPGHGDPTMRDKIADLRRDGMVLFHDFLEPEHFEQVKSECQELLENHKDSLTHLQYGSTSIDLAEFKKIDASEWSATERFLNDPRLVGLLQAGEKTQLNLDRAHRAVEHAVQKATEEKDIESDLHSDIFYHTHKAWLYLNDVEMKDAPLSFVKGSHRLTFGRCREIYRHSCQPLTPSRRISQEELKASGNEEIPLLVPKNTLAVANVCAYHRRLPGQPGGDRLAVIVSVRSQPFIWWKTP